MSVGVAAEPLALPTRRDEAWRYAPHRTLADLRFGQAGELAAVPAELTDQIPDLGGPTIVVVNGVVDLERSVLDSPDGVRISTLAEVDANSAPVASAHTAFEPADAFGVFNKRFGTDGAVVEIAAGCAVDLPIHIVDVAIPDSVGSMSCTGVVITLGEQSSATVVETRVGYGDSLGGSSVRTTVDLAEGSGLEHIVLQDLPAAQVHLSSINVSQAANSTFSGRAFNLGSVYGRFAYDVNLVGPGATADLSGLFYGFGAQTLDQQITVVHAATDCTSRQAFRGVLDDESTGVFNGGIDVRVGADGTDASQSNDNLILSNRAEINTQPRLEILADEVSCVHGATVGQLDDDALYYLRSRGIGSEDARRILVNGFSDQTVDAIGVAQVRSWISKRLGHDEDA